MTRGREQRTAPILSHGQTTSGQCGFNQAASHPADPIKRHRARRERSHPKAMLTTQASAVALDLLENSIGGKRKFDQAAGMSPVRHFRKFRVVAVRGVHPIPLTDACFRGVSPGCGRVGLRICFAKMDAGTPRRSWLLCQDGSQRQFSKPCGSNTPGSRRSACDSATVVVAQSTPAELG
jgi:hypothetical protein